MMASSLNKGFYHQDTGEDQLNPLMSINLHRFHDFNSRS